ncbi:MAG: hypothetical protein KZQ94_15995 [Candidatus Thiodiazotropha sp. (ex Troendleina suluensis)]|nr:hypothetical protein [Candidatus Thiodiazotropha sp. (ex Troendleina suluensis)]
MGFWRSVFSAPETLSKASDAVIRAGDAIVFTDEEKSKANMAILEWTLKFHEASKGSNLARRLLAIMFVGVFLFFLLLIAFLYMVGADFMAAKIFGLVNGELSTPVSIIIAFYFTSGMVRDFRNK